MNAMIPPQGPPFQMVSLPSFGNWQFLESREIPPLLKGLLYSFHLFSSLFNPMFSSCYIKGIVHEVYRTFLKE